MIGDNAWGLFDQLHHRSRCSFCGSHKSSKLCVDAKNNYSMSQTISKRLIFVLVFPLFGASKPCSEYLQQEFNLSSLNLGLGTIESGDSFTWVVRRCLLSLMVVRTEYTSSGEKFFRTQYCKLAEGRDSRRYSHMLMQFLVGKKKETQLVVS